MPDTNWVLVGASLFGGGACGAVITNVVSAVRNRKQPVGYRIDMDPVFEGTLSDSGLPARLTITDPSGPVELDNLFLAELQFVNRGNKDLKDFRLGITLAGDDRVIHVAPKPRDRFHTCNVSPAPTPKTPLQTVDFTLSPFSRGDLYSLKIYIVIPKGATEPAPIAVGSPEPVVFVGMPTLSELAIEAARGVSIGLGPIRVSVSS
jgi:hypothetical protein